MRGVLVERPDEVVYGELPVPVPGPWDVLVESRVAGVCRTDRGDVSLIGSFSYTSAVWSRVVGLFASGRVDFSPLVTHRFPADEFERAFALLESPDSHATKVLLEHA